MPSPMAVVFDDDPLVRERARDALTRAGIGSVVVATPQEALETLSRIRADEARRGDDERILGRSDAAERLRQGVQELAVSRAPVAFAGEAGSGRRYAARCLHASSLEPGSFVVVSPEDLRGFDAALAAESGTVFLESIEALPWNKQEELAEAIARKTVRPRVVASLVIDPALAAEGGRLVRSLAAAFAGSVVRVPPLRERRPDIAILATAFVEELRRLNGLPPLALAPETLRALEGYPWPGNVGQLRGAVEAAVILAAGGSVRPTDLPAYVFAAARPVEREGFAQRRFREAKRSVVDDFERAYLAEILKHHRGNVTSAADQSGMLRSALQRLLRKHGLHSADFRGAGTPNRNAR